MKPIPKKPQTQTDQTDFERTVTEGLRHLYKQTAIQNQLLERIASAVELLASASASKAGPRYMKTVDEFPNFNWLSIGAEVMRRDKDRLPDLIKWKEQIYQRRAKNDQDGNVWFSRSLGNKEYDVLIRFIEPPKSKRLDLT